eukprot:6584134-Pyramimonas_sp.AAC.1
MFLIPRSLAPGIRKCHVAWKKGRELQLIPSARPRDHLPVYLEIEYALPVFIPDPQHFLWDYNKLAEALQRGTHRRPFHAELEVRFASAEHAFTACKEDTHTDRHYDSWIAIVQDTARKHFERAPIPQNDVHRVLRRERLAL